MSKVILRMGAPILGIVVLFLGACTPTTNPSPEPAPTVPPASAELAETIPGHGGENTGMDIGDEQPVSSNNIDEPVLPKALVRSCNPAGQFGISFDAVGLEEGEKAINFKLKDVQGNEFVLSRLLADKPVVMIFGSFT